MLKAWAQAWSNRDIAGYLGFYAPDFVPAQGKRGTWARERERIIGEAGSIKLDLSDIRLTVKDKDSATTSFGQAYQSPIFRDVVNKTLEWKRVDGKWRIVREYADQAMRPISTRD